MDGSTRNRRARPSEGLRQAYSDAEEKRRSRWLAHLTRHGWKLLLLVCIMGAVVLLQRRDTGIPKSAAASSISLRQEGRVYSCGIQRRVVLAARHMNDDFCDCMEDGLDEPLTSACSHVMPPMQFPCGGGGGMIPTTRVRDGICDCGDCSDEVSVSP
ncbi:Aste57867_18716 [Aphanomyces stellatus]|uniref:Aste57867_18716 protein n=1 Tax=Aphanomyces stellatus TaxID=120398 RepID=A0A485LAT5_9STRA|nr:hypothetical protein As57867_018652 [Aphanomyces stellatus]VFT95450.1 Aste57867_18716 [Aphanomyces stellatus]